MTASRRPAPTSWQRLAVGLLLGAPLTAAPLATAPLRGVSSLRLFRVMTMRGDVLLGLTAAELSELGPGPDAQRLARRLATEGVLAGWRYRRMPGPDGRTCLGAFGRVSVAAQDALTVQPYLADLPVLPPPG